MALWEKIHSRTRNPFIFHCCYGDLVVGLLFSGWSEKKEHPNPGNDPHSEFWRLCCEATNINKRTIISGNVSSLVLVCLTKVINSFLVKVLFLNWFYNGIQCFFWVSHSLHTHKNSSRFIFYRYLKATQRNF